MRNWGGVGIGTRETTVILEGTLLGAMTLAQLENRTNHNAPEGRKLGITPLLPLPCQSHLLTASDVKSEGQGAAHVAHTGQTPRKNGSV